MSQDRTDSAGAPLSPVIEAPDLDAALAIAGTNPVIRDGGGVEVRPIHSSYLRPAAQ